MPDYPLSCTDNAVVGQRRTATASFLVNITDVNDNRPMFEATPTVGPVLEDVSMGTVITTVKASDLDSGSNGQVIGCGQLSLYNQYVCPCVDCVHSDGR